MLFQHAAESASIHRVGSDIECRYPLPIDAKYHAKIGFDHRTVNRVLCPCRQCVDFMGSQRRMKRIGFKDIPCSPDGSFL